MTEHQSPEPITDVLYNALEDMTESELVRKIKNAIANGHIEFVSRTEEEFTDETVNMYNWEVTVKLEFTCWGDQENVILEEFIRENTR